MNTYETENGDWFAATEKVDTLQSGTKILVVRANIQRARRDGEEKRSIETAQVFDSVSGRSHEGCRVAHIVRDDMLNNFNPRHAFATWIFGLKEKPKWTEEVAKSIEEFENVGYNDEDALKSKKVFRSEHVTATKDKKTKKKAKTDGGSES